MKLPSLEDYEIAIDTEQLIKAAELKGGHPEKHNDELVRYVGGFCVVFPFCTLMKKYAVRCWLVNVSDAKERTKLIADELQRIQLPYFVGFHYLEQGLATNEGIQPVVLMDWVDAMPFKDYISQHINDSVTLIQLAASFKTMVEDLHHFGISHGDLQHGNIMVKSDGSLVLVDYDSMYVPGLEDFDDEIKGLEGYQHPSRWKMKKMSRKADYFSELIIYTSLMTFAEIPSLWKDKNIKDTETMLFSADDIKSRGKSSIFAILDSNTHLAQYSSAIKKELMIDNIEDLQPLEDVVVSNEQKIVSSAQEKWKNNGYVPEIVDYSNSIYSIQEKWKDNGYSACNKEYDIDTDEISQKWK